MTPVTVFTGSLGAGKTTIILNLVKQLDPSLKIVWLKNEYGDLNIDSKLASGSNIQTTEILNGCLCCVLVGKLHDALLEITQEVQPDHLIIETAGTAYPYPIYHEVMEIPELRLDGLLMVIDALNFTEFHDKSHLARSQSKFLDLIIINKTGLVDGLKLERVMDEVFDLYMNVPKIQTADGWIDPTLLLGLNAKKDEIVSTPEEHHHDELESFNFSTDKRVDVPQLISYLESLDRRKFIRIKGLLNDSKQMHLINVVAGRVDTQELNIPLQASQLLFVGDRIATKQAAIIQHLEQLTLD